MPGTGDRAGPRFCPAKPKTEHDVLGIGCVWMLSVQVFYRYCGVRKMQWWW